MRVLQVIEEKTGVPWAEYSITMTEVTRRTPWAPALDSMLHTDQLQ